MRTLIISAILAHLLGTTLLANVCTSVVAGWGTRPGVQCTGHAAGGVVTYTVTWRNASGTVTGTNTFTPQTSAAATIRAPAGVNAGDTWTVVATPGGRCGSGTQLAALDPPATTAVATHTLTGGTVTGLGETFDLAGGFQVLADSLDQDPMSATFGRLRGFVPVDGFNIAGKSTSSERMVQLRIDVDQPFVTNLSALLQSPFETPADTNFDIGFFGTMEVSGLPSPLFFEGAIMGTSSYRFGKYESPEDYAVQFQLFTEMGQFDGSFTSKGSVRVKDRFPDVNFSFDFDAGCAILTYPSVNGVAFGVLGGVRPDLMFPLDPTLVGNGGMQQYKHIIPGNSPNFFYRFVELSVLE